MRLQLAQMFVLAAREFDMEVELREPYSGRNFNKATAGVTFYGVPDMLRLCAFLGANFKSLVRQVNEHFRQGEDAVPMGWTLEDMIEDLGEIRFDSMGHGRIAY